MKLISYCIPTDDGAALNPFFGVCTLVICKPVIRRATAEVGDWVVGVGSKNVYDANGVSYQDRLVYAMQVTRKMSMADYDCYVALHLPGKIPDLTSRNVKRHVGDSIYDFSKGVTPIQRPGVHGVGNIERDLGGENALLSDHFYYFGASAVLLPAHLQPIVLQGQSHKFENNDQFLEPFLEWISNYPVGRNGVPYGLTSMGGISVLRNCAHLRMKDDLEDEAIGNCD